ncbi:MAG: flagellar export protein FliJ [Candidatus Scalindua sp.]|nr:flagellar export protein FliJ [Candidatus Scalindua sp.]
MRYHFRLQPLLEKEQIHEGEFVRGLKVLKDIFREEEDKLAEIKKKRDDTQKRLGERKQIYIDGLELRLYEDYFVKIDNDEKDSMCLLKEIEIKIEIVQRELTKIMKRRKALEKLKEKGKSEHLNNLQMSLNKEMDDIAIMNFSKRH